MKRVSKALTALLLALVMTVTLLPVQVLAAESGTEERTFTGTYVNPAYAGRIAGTVQARTAMAAVAAEPKNAETVYTSVAEAAAALRRQMTARSNSMTVALYADSDDWQAVALSVWNTALDHVAGSGNTGDYLHWQYAGVSYSASYRASGTGYQYSLTYTPNPKVASTIWYTTAAQEQQLDGHIRGTILPQLALDGKTAYQKVQAIYGWITRNVSYDHDNLYDNSYLLKYTAYAAAVNRTAVCQGYANLFYRLANDAGLDCRIITGMANGGSGAEAHAWNIVRMEDGKYYCVDATWDAGRSSYRYFLKGLDAFKTDHTAMTDEKNSTYWTEYVGKVSAEDYVPGSTAVVETPANVTMKSAAVSGSSIVVTWEAAANAKTYIVYRKAAGETGWSIIAKSVSGTSYTDKSVTAGIPYTYTVRGVASDGKTMSAGYDTVGKTATVPAVPANVTMKSAAVSGTSIVVTWEAAENAKTYIIYRKTKSTNWTVLVSGVSGTSYTDKSVTAGEPYTYTVRGVASDGKTMSAGYDGTGVTATVPAAGVLASGNCGPSGTDDSSITWKLTSDGVLTFTGKGSLGDYYTPWLRDDLIEHIKKVVIGSGITYVGSNLFYDCSNLTELTLPNTVQAIGIEAFSCTRLRDVVIPDSVTTIYDGAFRYCYEMETLSLGSGVTSIGPAAFERSTAKVTLSSKNTAFSLQDNVLFDRNKTTLVQCFNGDVATYTVPSTVKELGDYSFAGLDRLETVIIPNGVTRLGEGIFENCKALVKVDIPASVTEIGSEAFAFSGKARVSVAARNTAYCSRDGALFTKNMDTLLHGGAATGHYTVPNGVVSIENGAFAEAAITGITFPSSLKYVGRIAFFGCTELTSLTIPSTVQALDGQAFAYCEKLTSVTIENGLQTLPYLVFQECRALETVVIPKSVTGIHSEAFLNCSALKTVVYGGTKAEWDKIEIGDGNEALTKAALRCTGVTTAVPANVTMKSAAVSGTSIVVTWEAAANAKTYIIYRKTKSTNWTVLVSGVSGTSYTDKSVTAGEPYTYTVRGVAADGRTMSKGYDGTGKTATVPKPDSGVPANVTMKSAAVSGTSIVVTWEAAENAKTYTIYRKTKNTNWTVIANGVSGTSYTDKSVTAGETYTYTVRGVASDGKTMSKGYDGTGKTATVPKPDSGVPANVTMKSAAVSGTSIVVTWEAAENAKTYTIYRKTKNTNWTVLVSGVSGTSYTDKSVTAGETYTYTVRGVAADGRTMSPSYDRAGKTAKVPDASAVPDPVTMVGAVADSTGITVTWKTAMGAAAYTIYRKTAGTNWTVLVSGVKGTSYVDNTALAKGTYTYTVRGVAADGRTMSPSYDRTGKTATMPETVVPANVKLGKATADAAGITVTWEAAANAKTYAIYRKTGSTSWTLLTTKASGTSYKDLTAARNQLYTYTVRGVAADGRTMSAGYDHTGVSARITASASTRPDRVKLQSAERLSDGILVTWEAAANARTYVVYRSKVVSGQASGWTAIARDVTNTYYKDIGGVSGTLYAYTVIGVAADGKTTSPSYHTYGVRATMP